MDVNRDYRNTDYCPSLTDVDKKKNELENRIRGEHHKVKIIYNLVKDKQREYFQFLAEIYNNKCAYCGTEIRFTDIRLFEVDHFVCESAFTNDTAGRSEAGKIRNLAFSCYSCNRGKSALHIKDEYLPLLYPDDNSIANIFERNDVYYIEINSAYSEDAFIKLFYEKLLFGSEARRLDYLLLEMENFKNRLEDCHKELSDKLEQCISKLLKKKNCTFVSRD